MSNAPLIGSSTKFVPGTRTPLGTTVPATGGNWTIGEQLATTPLRYMYKPSKDGSSPDAWSSTVGNLDVQGKLPHEKYYHLFEPLPAFLQVEAFIDRIHAYIPGWEIPKIGPDSVSQDYGFITDYFWREYLLWKKTLKS